MAEDALARWQRDRPSYIAVDTETEGVAFFDRPFCVTYAWETRAGDIETAYIELPDEKGRLIGHGDVECPDLLPIAREIMLGTPGWIFHNAKFDIQKTLLAGVIDRHHVTPNRIEDTEALAHLDAAERIKKLKWLGENLLGIPNTEEAELKKAMAKHKLKLEDGYHLLPREVVVPYAVQDVVLTVKLFRLLAPRVLRFPELHALYEHELELTLVLLDMEARGMRLDLEYVNATYSQLSREYIQAEQRLSEIVGKPIGPDVKAGEFNPDSSPQIKQFFQERNYETPFVTKTGNPSYGKKFLATCDHPIAGALTEYRRVAKLKNTYFLAMKNEQRNGILHPNIRQHGTRTGRMSSGEAEA